VLCGYLKLQRIVSSGFKMISESENCWLLFFEKKPEPKNRQSWLLQKPKRTGSFHEEPQNNWPFYGLSFFKGIEL
jgi:hypothetical protein